MYTGTEEKQLVTPAAAAKHVGVSVVTIRRRIRNGTLPAHRLGPRLVRVDLNDVEALMSPIPSREDPADKAARLARFIEKHLAAAPPLSDAQRADLARMFAGGAG